MPGYLGYGGPQVQELEFVQSEEGLALVLSHTLLQGFDEDWLYERDPVLLLDNIKSAEFTFLLIDENGEPSDWTASWDDENQLPAAVALEIEFNEDVFIQWPMLTTSVRIDPGAVSGSASPTGEVTKDYGATIRNLMNKKKE